MAIENNNLFSESFAQLKAFLNTNITDPRHRFKKQWIHASEPNLTDKGFDGYPFMVISMDVGEENHSLERNTSQKTFRATLSAYSEDPDELDTLCDEILQKFRDRTLTDSLSDFRSIEVATSPFVFRVIGGKKIMIRNMGIIGRKRL